MADYMDEPVAQQLAVEQAQLDFEQYDTAQEMTLPQRARWAVETFQLAAQFRQDVELMAAVREYIKDERDRLMRIADSL